MNKLSLDSFTVNSQLGDVSPDGWTLNVDENKAIEQIGTSREGRPLYGISVGDGPLRVSITAGAHADEPVGPRTALLLAEAMITGVDPFFQQLAKRATFRIVPHVNPDGEIRNRTWMNAQEKTFETYSHNVVRELPGDDVEFNYPTSSHDQDTRPENLAVAEFLKRDGKPFHLHASLHSMAVACGAWYLVCKEWKDRWKNSEAERSLVEATRHLGLPLHHWDRKGEKGFAGISPGFSTTPTSVAMREFFEKKNDHATASLFRPSSMEFVQSLGGDPLCLVSELPAFVLGNAKAGEAADAHTQFEEFCTDWRKVRHEPNQELRPLLSQYELKPVSIQTQMELQVEFLMSGLKLVEGYKA